MNRLILLVFCALLSFNSIAQDKTLTILYTNDIESVYEPIEAFWNEDIEYIGGLPYLSTLIKEVRAEEQVSFLLDAGDIFTGALSEVTKGKLPFDVYSSMGYEAIALGNHEFEYGWEELLNAKQRARFPVLNCNIFYENTDIHFCQSYTILEKEGIRIGLIGLMGQEAFKNTMNPAHRIGLEARDPYPIVQGIIDEIRSEVDVVILLTHQNLSAPMQTDKEVDAEVQRGFDEDYEMAGRLKGVDVIIGGHSDHGLWEPVVHPKTGTLICLTFGQGKYLGYLKLNLKKEGVKLEEGKLIPVDAGLLEPDEKIVHLIEKVRQENPALTEVLGSSGQSAYRKYYRESSIGNLFCDMLKDISDADIAIMNSGSLRADLKAGIIRTEDVINIYPFIDHYKVVEISGESLMELLEYSYQLNYGFVQVSGVKSKYNSSLEKGSRIQEVSVNGKALENNKTYSIACSAFLANGGDGFEMLKNGKAISQSPVPINESFINYIRDQKQLIVPPVNRQIDVSHF